MMDFIQHMSLRSPLVAGYLNQSKVSVLREGEMPVLRIEAPKDIYENLTVNLIRWRIRNAAIDFFGERVIVKICTPELDVA